MPVSTYIAPDDLAHASDPDIIETLACLTRPPIVNQTPVWVKRHWWSRAEAVTLYEVLWPLGQTLLGQEYQVVNFYRDDSENSINLVVPKSIVLAYLYGLSAGQRTPGDM
jgi:hypothetical protein